MDSDQFKSFQQNRKPVFNFSFDFDSSLINISQINHRKFAIQYRFDVNKQIYKQSGETLPIKSLDQSLNFTIFKFSPQTQYSQKPLTRTQLSNM